MPSLFVLLFLSILIGHELPISSATGPVTKPFMGEPLEIHLVGLFGSSKDDQEQISAFKAAIQDINKDSSLLLQTRLIDHVEIIEPNDALNISKAVCGSLSLGVTALFGPNSEEANSIVQSISHNYNIPHMHTIWNEKGEADGYSINLHPEFSRLSQGIAEVVHDMDWMSFTVLYEKDEDLLLLQELFKVHDTLEGQENYSPIIIRQLPDSDDYRPVLKDMKRFDETRILLMCAPENTLNVLNQASQIKLMGDYFSYLIAALDAHILDYSEFVATETNITIIRITHPDEFEIETSDEEDPKVEINLSPEKMKLSSILMYDAVYLFARGLDKFLSMNPLVPIRLSCEDVEAKWEQGRSLVDNITALDVNGVSGPIKIDANSGERTYFAIQIVQLINKGYKKLGTWDPVHKMGYTRNQTQMDEDVVQTTTNKTFIVVSRIGKPFLMLKEGTAERKGNDRFEGFSMDIMTAIGELVPISFEFDIAPDNKYGNKDPITGKWNGIIKVLQERRADLGICDLTITHDRRSAVEFTMPFMNLGISILFKEEEEEEPNYFTFLLPFKFGVWLCVATAFLCISILLFIVSRCAPQDWENPHPCDPESDELENPLNLVNCLWFSLGSVLQQGCDILPKAPSTRILAAMWWFFTMILVSTYTANLGAFLISQQRQSKIKDIEGLAKQSKIKFGCYDGGSTATFFRESEDNLYQKVWATMESASPKVFASSNDEGVARVLNDKQGYAFFMESVTIEYQMERHCQLTQIGGLLDSKGYGIAMPINSPYRTAISGAVLRMHETGLLNELKDKWWSVSEDKKCQRKQDQSNQEENALQVENFGGVFLVLTVGILFSFVLCVLEFLWNIRKVAVVEKKTLAQAFWTELKFVMNCDESTKPVRTTSLQKLSGDEPTNRYKELAGFSQSQES